MACAPATVLAAAAAAAAASASRWACAAASAASAAAASAAAFSASAESSRSRSSATRVATMRVCSVVSATSVRSRGSGSMPRFSSCSISLISSTVSIDVLGRPRSSPEAAMSAVTSFAASSVDRAATRAVRASPVTSSNVPVASSEASDGAASTTSEDEGDVAAWAAMLGTVTVMPIAAANPSATHAAVVRERRWRSRRSRRRAGVWTGAAEEGMRNRALSGSAEPRVVACVLGSDAGPSLPRPPGRFRTLACANGVSGARRKGRSSTYSRDAGAPGIPWRQRVRCAA